MQLPEIGAAAALALDRARKEGYRGAGMIVDEMARLFVVELLETGIKLRGVTHVPVGVAAPLLFVALPDLVLPADASPEAAFQAVVTELRRKGRQLH
ncbi:MAG TPA: hypothetical protein VF329_03455 [Gammaproteobacteria bacterium]